MKSLRSPQTLACFIMCVCTLTLTTLINSHAQNSGTIFGCAKQTNGQLRIVSGAGQCSPSENEISWSIGGGGSSSGGHLQKTTVVMNYGESQVLTLPEDNRPTMVNICTSPVGDTVSPPRSACVGGLFYRDSSNGRVVSTVHYEDSGNFGAGGVQLAINDEDGQLVLSNTACNDCGVIGPQPITYQVDMWY